MSGGAAPHFDTPRAGVSAARRLPSDRAQPRRGPVGPLSSRGDDGRHLGADYSASELTPAQLNAFKKYDIRFLIRYIGYPGNPKCISHYPGAYQAHVRAGRLVLLVAENATNDAQGWPHFYQYNNAMITIGGEQADLDWAYAGVLDKLRQGSPASPAASSHPGQVPPWPLPAGNYFGLITGPNASHGGFRPADRPSIRLIEQALIRKGYGPGVTDQNAPWASGQYTEPTREAVLRFQKATRRPQTGTVAAGDWAVLLA
jgi:hypothetical protein